MAEILIHTTAQRSQIEAIRRACPCFLGDRVCHRLAPQASKATMEGVLLEIRWRARAGASEIVAILNGSPI